MRYFVGVLLVGLMVGHGEHGEGGPTSVFARFPVEPEMYIPEVAELIRDGVVERFGEDEFASVVLSHEIHQHIGIYTVVGAKMGVRAREVLGAPRRGVKVTVDTIPDTPFACATDGIQAAMGSTYVQNLIAIRPDAEKMLECTFEYEGKTLWMRLKPEFAGEIQGIIKENSEEHGYLSAAYFDGIREACYRLWGEWDRRGMFEERLKIEERQVKNGG